MKTFIQGFAFTIAQFALVIAIAAGLSDCGGSTHDDHGGDGGGVATNGGGDSGGDQGDGPSASTPGPVSGPPTASISGVVKFEGPSSEPESITIPDAGCVAARGDLGPKYTSEAFVFTDDKLGNVFVYIKDLKIKYPSPSEQVKFDQKGCVYSPHVLGVMKKQELAIYNSDSVNHNVNFRSKIQPFNQSQSAGQPAIIKKFRRSEGPVPVVCNVHPWMNATIFVMDHPLFDTSDTNGTFELPEKLPPGKYTLAAWHETLGEITQEVTLAPDEAKSVTLTFKVGG